MKIQIIKLRFQAEAIKETFSQCRKGKLTKETAGMLKGKFIKETGGVF